MKSIPIYILMFGLLVESAFTAFLSVKLARLEKRVNTESKGVIEIDLGSLIGTNTMTFTTNWWKQWTNGVHEEPAKPKRRGYDTL